MSRVIVVEEQTDQVKWHAHSAEKAIEHLDTRSDGLTHEEAAERLAHYGRNVAAAPAQRGWLARLAAQFHNILIYVLIAAALVTAALGHWIDTAVIALVVIINALIGFIQEGKAESAMDAIRGMLAPEAMVRRNGQRETISAAEVVPGDILILEPGGLISADVRILAARGLAIDESALTGESVPVEKTAAKVDADAALGDRHGMAHAGTLVATGEGTGVVVATADRTELGQVTEMLANVENVTTPLLRRLNRLGKQLSIIILSVSAITAVSGVLLHGFSAVEMFMAAVGLAVAAIPEGLPAIMTITLALGVQRLARRNAIIRRLPAVETLGSITVICSDKTGTLTRNEMTVQEVAIANGSEQRLGEAVSLCSDAAVSVNDDDTLKISGDPMEAALLVYAQTLDLDPNALRKNHPRLDGIPFDSAHRYMASLHDFNDERRLIVKGAPEAVVPRCQDIDEDEWHKKAEAMAERGLRLLAVAEQTITHNDFKLSLEHPSKNLTLLGLVAIIDPPREAAIDAVAACRQAGIRVKMITGDHAHTAAAIGQQLGLEDTGRGVTGVELDALSDTEFSTKADQASVFARVSPAHKLRLVKALQANGEIVAMTGDGVNDAPALKRADVGVAMGQQGTDAAREASEVVLADDNFATIAAAIREGRVIYDNIVKSILFMLPTNAAQSLILVAAVFIGLTLPITPPQILWVNMITAVTLALALAFEPAEKGVMARAPRAADGPLIPQGMGSRLIFVALTMVIGTMGIFLWERSQGAELAEARTLAVNTLVLFEVWYLFSARRLHQSSFNISGAFGNRYVPLAGGVIILAQMAFTYAPPMQFLFDTHPLGIREWLIAVVVSLPVISVAEGHKWWQRKRLPPPESGDEQPLHHT
ncbi:MAG: HAD-IC family P-type ATPase [Gammaproteobacteria bacterium]|nr:HAD-IC family P-type ATPase [Gammaproteobacteria bacterium]